MIPGCHCGKCIVVLRGWCASVAAGGMPAGTVGIIEKTAREAALEMLPAGVDPSCITVIIDESRMRRRPDVDSAVLNPVELIVLAVQRLVDGNPPAGGGSFAMQHLIEALIWLGPDGMTAVRGLDAWRSKAR